jgi:hypothetical protein
MGLKYLSYLTALCVISVLFTSCSEGYLNISVLHPAEITLPAGVSNVTVYNRVFNGKQNGINDSALTAQHDPYKDYPGTKESYLTGIYETVTKSPRFRKVTLSDSSYGYTTEGDSVDWPLISTICERDSSDALIVLTRNIGSDTVNVYSFVYCYIYYTIINEHSWSIYYPADRSVISFALKDTLKWEGTNENCDPEIPGIYSLLSEACYNSGIRAGLYIAPYWEENIPRVIFTGFNRELSKAENLVNKNMWYEAGQIWNRLSESGNRRISAKAAFNIALAYEIDDNLEQSLSWIVYAGSLSENKYIKEYKNIILERMNTKKILDSQMHTE